MKPSNPASRLAVLMLFLLLWGHVKPAFAVSFGNIANWAAAPDATISLDDKNFVWLADSGNWTGDEDVNIVSILALEAHAFGIDELDTYVGPLTLSVSYRVDITSSNVFAAVDVDQDFITPNVTTYKDIYLTLEEFGLAGAPGSGTIALSITNFTPSPFPPVLLPPVQSLWVRDTIVLDGTGSLLSISNTFVQAVPEPSSIALAALGVGLAVALPRRLKRLRRAGPGNGLAA